MPFIKEKVYILTFTWFLAPKLLQINTGIDTSIASWIPKTGIENKSVFWKPYYRPLLDWNFSVMFAIIHQINGHSVNVPPNNQELNYYFSFLSWPLERPQQCLTLIHQIAGHSIILLTGWPRPIFEISILNNNVIFRGITIKPWPMVERFCWYWKKSIAKNWVLNHWLSHLASHLLANLLYQTKKLEDTSRNRTRTAWVTSQCTYHILALLSYLKYKVKDSL